MNCNLEDLGHQGPTFTWHRGRLKERLDRVCANEQWQLSFPDRVVTHLPCYCSDHRPLLLWEGPSPHHPGGSRPFRFLAAWLTHEDFPGLVQECWNGSTGWGTASETFRSNASHWHRECFREDAKLKNNLQARLRGIDRSLSHHPCHALEILQKDLWRQLNLIYIREDLTWFQRSRASWLKYGDRNTKFFHSTTAARRRRNRIDALKNDAGDWIGDPSILMNMAVEYYRNLFKEDNTARPGLPIRGYFPHLVQEHNIHIGSIPSNEEIRSTMDKVVMPNQCSFIKGRQGTNNVIIAQEIIHSMRSKKGAKGWMMIKVDLEKAYDRISWDFLRDTLQDVGPPPNLINLVMWCVSSCSMNVLWNGSTTQEFFPSRGLRQGDPLSPYLFILCMERLGHLISHAVRQKCWKPIMLRRNAPPISHLFFADDLILCADASFDQAQTISKVLDDFCLSSGQKVNHEKTKILFSHNVNHILAEELSGELGFSRTVDLGKYLGIPLHHRRVGRAAFSHILDRVQSRINAWNHTSLSLAGRITLSKDVLSAITAYTMQVSVVPLGICNDIEKHIRRFLWGSNRASTRPHLVAWDQLCMDKDHGGLGLRKMKEVNRAFIMKIGYGILSNPDALWARVLKSKYKVQSDLVPNISATRNSSSLWKAIVSSWPVILQHSRILLGNGNSTHFWDDPWVPGCGALSSYAAISDPSQINHQLMVSDLVSSSGSWMWGAFQHSLPDHVNARINNILPPSDVNGHDRILWTRTSDGSFSLKSAYMAISRGNEESTNLPWNRVWQWHGPERIQLLWSMVKIFLGQKTRFGLLVLRLTRIKRN
ncbi:uncharacterized protein LOC133308608 [Gastrolobium bilobum]|uniref:uncharacterized protein LOC133308608 n=1 Tax=Gastrolobium bilobum TaxID=150636 RepID=UPI002AB31E7C|nr:uncharacterized protein LOC133308608 [Gastrolobium bilobum]